MSKRGLKKLVDGKHVRGWDDPRLYTLIALRRRGVPPGAILSFINELGVTTANTQIQLSRFEQSVRRYLEFTVPRLMIVLDPLRIVIEDADSLESDQRDLTIPLSPKKPEFGTHQLRVTNTVFIDQSDFREVDSKDYFRLAPGKTVGLLNMPYPITATSFSKDADGKITEVRAVFNKDGKRPKTYIQWVPEGSRKVKVRIYTALFKSEDPASVEGGFLNDISPSSETIYADALIEPGFEEVRSRAPWPAAEGEKANHGPESVRFQGLRVAYFVSSSFFFVPNDETFADNSSPVRRF
jgi:glutaminyl-tRNA synthetase